LQAIAALPANERMNGQTALRLRCHPLRRHGVARFSFSFSFS
jgi:hypothetical protein